MYGRHLTPHMQLILQLIADGAMQHEIAEAFHIHPSTLKAELVTIRERLGARSTTHAVALALFAEIIR